MLRSDPCDPPGPPARGARFVLYVEGPSDSAILRSWARLVSPRLSRTLSASAVILGGRRPKRAVQHFRGILEDSHTARGLCVLDRDGDPGDACGDGPDGLEFFTWPRRHIESYLLVPAPMRRCMRMADDDPRLGGVLGDLPKVTRGEGLRDLDAKRLLADKSAVARELGAPLSPARIARCMRWDDLHPDVLDLLDRIGNAADLAPRQHVG